MPLLRLISWPYCRKHVLRTLLTMSGIALGVTVFVGMHTANRNVLDAFSRTVDRIAGRTQLQITAGDAGFDEAILETVRAASTVGVAAPVIEAVADTNLNGEGDLLVLGVDMVGDRSLRDYDLDGGDEAAIDDPLVFLAQPDSLIVSNGFADRHHLGVDRTLTLGTAGGAKAFTIRGVMRSSGLSSAFGGNLAVMDIYAAQKMLGRSGKFDRIDVAVKPGRTIAECQQELRAILGPAFQVDTPASRGQQFESMIAAYSMMVDVSSLFALFIGMFIIYNSFAIAVSQRRAEIGILRALGASRTRIRWLFLSESAILGIAGSVCGMVLGVSIARAIAASIGTVLADVYGVARPSAELVASPVVLAASLAIGVATSLIGALMPASGAARADPVQALQKGKYQLLPAAESRARAAAAAVLAAMAIVCLWGGTMRVVFYAGYMLAIVAALLVTPLVSLALARALRPLLKTVRPIEGALAADSLIQAPRRMAASAAALMLSLALVVAFGGMARASYNSIADWMEATLNPDLFVLASPRIVVRTILFPRAMGPELAAIPAVRQVEPVREARVGFRGTPIMIIATDLEGAARTAHRRAVQGDRNEMYRLAAAGQGLVVSENLAALKDLRLGDVVEIAAPAGLVRLPIVGIVVDYSDQQGTIQMDQRVFRTFWNDDSANLFRVYLQPGADVAAVRRRILDRYAGRRRVFVLTNGELKQYILAITEQWFALTSVQIAIAVLVAILGIVNTLTVSIIDRRRELGVLRAVGARRAQIRRTIWIEALSVGAIGLTLGCGLGAINLYYTLQMVQRDVAGMRLAYDFPFATVVTLVPTILGAAFVAALWPAEAAVRGSLVEALEYE